MSSPPHQIDRLTGRAWGILFVLCGAVFLEGVDVSMLGVALPAIRADLDMSTSALQWVVERVRARLRRLRAAGRPRGRPARPAPDVPGRARRLHRLLGPRRPRRRGLDADPGPLRHRRQRRLHDARGALDHHHDLRRGPDAQPRAAGLRRRGRGRVLARARRRRGADRDRLALGLLRARDRGLGDPRARAALRAARRAAAGAERRRIRPAGRAQHHRRDAAAGVRRRARAGRRLGRDDPDTGGGRRAAGGVRRDRAPLARAARALRDPALGAARCARTSARCCSSARS